MKSRPEVLARRGEGDEVVFDLQVSPELDFFAGHFPGRPILPGVIQVQWAIAFARELGWGRGEFQALEQLKFNALVRPPARLSLRLIRNAQGLQFAYSENENRCSSGRVRFGDAGTRPSGMATATPEK